MTRDFSPMPSPSNAPEAVTDIVDMINPRQIMRSAVLPACIVLGLVENSPISWPGIIRHIIVPNIIIMLFNASVV